MGWDERLFGALFGGARRLLGIRGRAERGERQARAAHLRDVAPRLGLLASAVSGRAVEIAEAEGAGGGRGVVLRLPAVIDDAESPEQNALAYLYRACFAATALRLELALPAGTSTEAALAATRELAPRIIAALEDDLPRLAEVRQRLAGVVPDERLLGPLPVADAASGGSSVAPPPDESGGVTSERAGKVREALRRIDLGEDPLDENPLVHSFEKVHTAEEYKGGRKRADGSDQLAEHAQALDELDLREVVRSRERARSLLRADLLLDGDAPDVELGPDDGGVPYDEWEERTRSYRAGWCRVHPRRARAGDPRGVRAAAAQAREVLSRHASEVRALRERFSAIEAARAIRPRQPDGPEVDIDAMVDRHASLAAGHSGPDRLYLSRRRRGPDLAVLVLLDASLSTDGWVAGRRVIDVARESTLVLCAAVEGHPVEVGVAAFFSNTRRDCRFLEVAAIGERAPVAGGVGARLLRIEPAGYTRIGPALRHGTRLLERSAARKRLLLLVSDGKPTDYDRYEGRHGIADVRQAVREARQRQVHTFALAIDAQARHYLPRMFGAGGFEILPRPDRLTSALGQLFTELMR